MVMEGEQEVLVELEGGWELDHHLPHTVQELGEDGGRLSGVSSQMAVPGGGEDFRTMALTSYIDNKRKDWARTVILLSVDKWYILSAPPTSQKTCGQRQAIPSQSESAMGEVNYNRTIIIKFAV